MGDRGIDRGVALRVGVMVVASVLGWLGVAGPAVAQQTSGSATDPLVNLVRVPGGAAAATLYVPDSTAVLPYGNGGRCPTVAQDRAAGVPLSADGVPMYARNGRLWEHPVRQASSGLACIYGDRSDPNRLERARADGQHLLAHAISARGALYFAYPFDFAVGGNTRYVSKAPWCSAMAQGQVLSLFLALYQAATDPVEKQQWQDAADKTALSLEIAAVRGKPSVTFIDAAGYLWFEEYAGSPVPGGERVLNGHIFAMWGLYDYWRMASQPDYWTTSSTIHSEADLDTTRRFIGAGIATVHRYVWTKFRNPAGPTFYSIGNHFVAPRYHAVHIDQFLRMQVYTGDPRWANYATQFRADYPTGAAASRVQFKAGFHTLYRLSGTGAVVATRVVHFPRATGAPTDARRRILGGRPVGDRISAGPYAGWWAGEVPGRSGTSSMVGITHALRERTLTLSAGRSTHFTDIGYRWNVPYARALDGSLTGQWIRLGPDARTDAPSAPFRVAAGAYTAVRIDSTGAVTAVRRSVLPSPSSARYGEQIMLGSRIYVLVTTGVWKNLWLPVVRGVSVY